jgi:hypothetical protein
MSIAMIRRSYLAAALLLLILALGACSILPTEDETPPTGADQATPTELILEATAVVQPTQGSEATSTTDGSGSGGGDAGTTDDETGSDGDATEAADAEPTETPTAEPTAQTCLNKASVDDLTVLDDTVFAPGETFEKSWTVVNKGECVWTDDYGLVFVGGDAMGASQDPVPFLQTLFEPGEEVIVSVTLTAPDEEGTYRGDWLLDNGGGQRFGWGTGDSNQEVFWVQIVVEGTEPAEPTATPNPEDPSILGSPPVGDLGSSDWRFDPNANWEFSTDNLEADMVDGELRLRSPNAIGQDRWFVPLTDSLSDFWMEAVFRTGSSCSGLDRYGLVIRVSGNFSETYVVDVSCDGRYRIYKLTPDYGLIQDWSSSAVINTGPEAYNRIGILAEGNDFTIYINGQQITTFEDSAISSGPIGFLVAAADNDNFRVFLTDAAYWELD